MRILLPLFLALAATADWQLDSSLDARIRYDSSLLPRSGGNGQPEESLVRIITPAVTLQGSLGEHRLRAGYRAKLSHYKKLPARDAIDHGLRLSLGGELAGNKWSLSENFAWREDSGGEKDDTITRVASYAHTRVGLSVSRHLDAPTTLRLSLAHDARDYLAPSLRDGFSIEPRWQLAHQVNRRDHVQLEHSYRYYAVNRRMALETNRVLLGYRRQLGPMCSINAGFGGLLEARLEGMPLGLSWDHSASLQSVNSEMVRRDRFRLSPKMPLSDCLSLAGDVTVVHSASPESGRVDTLSTYYGLSLRKELSAQFRAKLAYRHLDQQARGSGDSLSRNIVELAFRASF
jgi:hypothetical protein